MTHSINNNRGQAIIMASIATFAIMVVIGLALDLGRFYLVRAELAKAVDGAALAGASVLPMGAATATNAAREFAEMNFGNGFMATTAHAFTVSFDPDPTQSRIRVAGTADLPTTFMQLVGINMVTVPANAEAERRPLSISLVLDNSYSMHPDYAGADAIGYLKIAGVDFVGYFDDAMDQMALTLFSTGVEVRQTLSHGFSASMTSTIRGMSAVSSTNLSDALDAGYDQLQNDLNPSTFQALVYFTDGRPTAMHDRFQVGGKFYDAVIKGNQDPTGSMSDQLWRADRLNEQLAGINYSSSTFPNGMPKTSANLQFIVNQDLLASANAARNDGITIYVIGLGNPSVAEWWKQPDVDLLVTLANVPDAIDPHDNSVVVNSNFDPNQPQGGFYFAPDPSQLNAVFEQVAKEIVLRLTQ